MKQTTLVIGLMFASACGGSSDNSTGGDSDTTPKTCTMTFSGDLTLTASECAFSADVTDTTFEFLASASNDSDDNFGFSFNTTSADTAPKVRTYTQADFTTAHINLIDGDILGSSYKSWSEDHGSDPDDGTVSLSITTVGTTVDADGSTTWASMHGTFDATATPNSASTASGNVTIHAEF